MNTRELLWRRSAWRCEIRAHRDCTGEATDWHHRQRRREGDDSAANAVHICRTCHQHVHANPRSARGNGWIVSAWADPAATPLYRRGRWVRLAGDGSLHPAGEDRP